MDSVLAFLSSVTGTVATIAIVSFVVLNAGFIAFVMLKRDRSVVNKLTKPLVVADAILLLAAGGAPVANWAVQVSAKAVALVVPGGGPRQISDVAPPSELQVDPLTGEVVAGP